MTTADIAAVAKLSDAVQPLLAENLGPSRFVRLLEARELFQDAIRFLSHGLPIDIAIRWACACSRELLPPDQIEKGKASLEAAEAWLQSRDDQSRWAAKHTADKSALSSPGDLIALAAFFSGGSVTPPDAPVTPPPPYVANKMVSGGILLAVHSQQPEKAAERYRKTLQISREIAKPERAG